MTSAIRPSSIDRLRSWFSGVPARAYAVRRLAREDLHVLEAKRDALASRMAESIELLDRYIDPLERYMDGDRLLSPLGTILDRRSGKNLPLVWTELDLREFRRWARVICDINPYAIGFLGVLTDYHIRLGYAWHVHRKGLAAVEDPGDEDPLVRQVQAALECWRDVNRWALKSREAFRRWHRDGETFLRFFRGERGCLPEIRFVEPEQVGPPPGDDADGRWSFGILTDPDDVMNVKAYFVRNPLGTGSDGVEVPANRIVHLKANVDCTIKRGITSFLPVQEDVEHVRKLIRNLGEVGGIQSAIAWIAQYAVATPQQVANLIKAGADYTRPKLGSPSGKLIDVARYEPGTILHMDESRQFLAGPGSVNAQGHIAIVQAILRGVGFRFRMPEWVSGDASNNTYNSALIAGAPLSNMVESGQQEWGVLERETAIKVIELSVESGLLPRETLDRVDVRAVPPAVVQATRKEENDIYNTQHQAGCLSKTTWQQKAGLIPAIERANFAKEAKDQAMGQTSDPGSGTGNPGNGGTAGYGGIFREAVSVPGPLLVAIVEAGFTGELTDSNGRKRHYVDGSEVAGQGSGSGGSAGNSADGVDDKQHETRMLAALDGKIAAFDPEAAKKPSLMQRFHQACITAVARANLFLIKHQEKIDAMGTLLGAVIDTPQDLQKLGYNPSVSSGGHQSSVQDPMTAHAGISTHLACTIASHAITAAFQLAKKRMGGRKEAIESADVYELAAELLGRVLAAVDSELRLEGLPDVSMIAAKLRELHGAKK